MASSILFPGEKILDDHSQIITPSGLSTGYEGMYRAGYAAYAGARAFPSEFLIDPSEYQARIEEMESTKTRTSDMIVQGKLPPKNQQQTNFCWGNSPTHIVEILRVIAGEQMVILSPASVCAPITGFKNRGGMGEDAVNRLSSVGAVPVAQWPANAIDKHFNTPANQKLAMDYRITDWLKLTPRNFQQVASLVLRRIPVALGYDWWGHEVTGVDLVWLNGVAELRIRNSWGDIPDWPNGFGVLTGSKKIPDDAIAPDQVIAS